MRGVKPPTAGGHEQTSALSVGGGEAEVVEGEVGRVDDTVQVDLDGAQIRRLWRCRGRLLLLVEIGPLDDARVGEDKVQASTTAREHMVECVRQIRVVGDIGLVVCGVGEVLGRLRTTLRVSIDDVDVPVASIG